MNSDDPQVLQFAQALVGLLGRSSPDTLQVVTAHSRYVTVELASRLTGFTEKAIRRKIEEGIWLEGKLWRRAPDGHILIDMKGYDLWVEKAQG